MACSAKCILFFLLAICFSLQTHARDSKFFSKVTKQAQESISVSPTIAPTLAPSPSLEAEVIEHGYGLYGQDPSQSYEYPPATTNPTKVGEDKYVSNEEFSNMNHYQENGKGKGNRNGIGEKQGMSDTSFLENGKYYHDPNQDVKDESSGYFRNGGNGYETERQGMSDTRFLENGKYFHDINDEKDGKFNTKNYEDDENFERVKEENNGHFNTNNYENENQNEGSEDEKQGMSDTRFLENGKYYYDVNQEAPKEAHYGRFETHNNGNGNGNEEHHGMSDTRFLENGKYYYGLNEEAPREGNYGRFEAHNHGNGNDEENHGMSDTRFLENGKYYYDVNNEKGNNNYNHDEDNKKFGVEDVGFHSNNNVEYANRYHGHGNGNEYEYEGKGEYEKEGEGGHNYNRNEYHVKERRGGYNGIGGKPKKFPNVYDTMEEYDREQGYVDVQDQYIP